VRRVLLADVGATPCSSVVRRASRATRTDVGNSATPAWHWDSFFNFYFAHTTFNKLGLGISILRRAILCLAAALLRSVRMNCAAYLALCLALLRSFLPPFCFPIMLLILSLLRPGLFLVILVAFRSVFAANHIVAIDALQMHVILFNPVHNEGVTPASAYELVSIGWFTGIYVYYFDVFGLGHVCPFILSLFNLRLAMIAMRAELMNSSAPGSASYLMQTQRAPLMAPK
jgi:hypothetical protein